MARQMTDKHFTDTFGQQTFGRTDIWSIRWDGHTCGRECRRAKLIAPEPQQISRTLGDSISLRVLMANSTSCSVSGRGMNTGGTTLRVRQWKSHSPRMYCTGILRRKGILSLSLHFAIQFCYYFVIQYYIEVLKVIITWMQVLTLVYRRKEWKIYIPRWHSP